MKIDRLYTEAALAGAAKAALDEAGLSQSEAARQMGVTRAWISMACNAKLPRMVPFRIKIIEHFTNLKVVGPTFRLVPKK